MSSQTDDQEDNTVEIVNISSEPMKFELDKTRIKMGPKERRHIHKAYALPKQMQPGKDPVPSTVDMLTNGKVLWVGDERVKRAGLAPRPEVQTQPKRPEVQ